MNLIRIWLPTEPQAHTFRYRDTWWSDDLSSLRVCPWCHKVWAKVTMQHPYHHPLGASCIDCPPWRPQDPYGPGQFTDIPGSLLDTNQFRVDRYYTLLEFLPEPLLERELTIHLQALDRNIIMLSPEDLSKLQLYRARITSGEQLPIEEQKAAIALLRSDRMAAAQRAKESKTRGPKAAKAPTQNPLMLLAKLGIKS